MERNIVKFTVGFFIVVLVGLIALHFLAKKPVLDQKQATTQTPEATLSATLQPTQPYDATVNTVKIYLIALNDNGKTGMQVGCGDSIVAVDRDITPTTDPLKVALDNLFSLKVKNYGQTKLYNSLYQSKLHVTNISISKGGIATIMIKGTYALGGVCDAPRFVEQIKQTALQFPSISDVVITINGLSLDKIASLK